MTGKLQEIKMARFLIATSPAVGHFIPALQIVQRLVERGHTVWYYSNDLNQAKIEAVGAHFTPIKSQTRQPPDPKLDKMKGIARLGGAVTYAFVEPTFGHVMDCLEILKEFPADVLLTDSIFPAAQLLHEITGLPYANFGDSILFVKSQAVDPIGLAWQPSSLPLPLDRIRNRLLNFGVKHVLFRDLNRAYEQVRAKLGLSRDGRPFWDTLLSPYLYIAGTVPSFEYPRSDLPKQIHFTGSFLAKPSANPNFVAPDWWRDLESERPVVHVTQGTIDNNPTDLIIPTIKAFAGQDVLVVATTSGKPLDPTLLENVPVLDNVRVEEFIPHAHLLPKVDFMITNGGYGAVQMALAHGIPLVLAGTTADKPEIGARVEWSGVGINLKTKTPTIEQLRRAVQTLQSNPLYRQKAREMATEMSRYDGPGEAALLLEQLALTKRPVVQRPLGAKPDVSNFKFESAEQVFLNNNNKSIR
jgi:MGT family glycosyltransferase